MYRKYEKGKGWQGWGRQKDKYKGKKAKQNLRKSNKE